MLITKRKVSTFMALIGQELRDTNIITKEMYPHLLKMIKNNCFFQSLITIGAWWECINENTQGSIGWLLLVSMNMEQTQIKYLIVLQKLWLQKTIKIASKPIIINEIDTQKQNTQKHKLQPMRMSVVQNDSVLLFFLCMDFKGSFCFLLPQNGIWVVFVNE